MRRVFAGAVVAATALAAAACGSQSSAGTFKPPAPSPVASASPAAPSPAPSVSAAADSVVMPPFPADAKVDLDSYAGDASTASAVVTAKDMLLAIEYAYYTGGKDTGWKAYTNSSAVVNDLTQELADPSVTSTSWTGTVVITHMSAQLGTYGKNTALVTFCANNAGAKNASQATHQALPASQQAPISQDYYQGGYGLSGGPSSWTVTQILPDEYAPRAPKECGP